MERELLIEIGTEELPARWLPGLTAQIGQALEARLTEARISIDEPVQTFSTPRRLTACVGRIGDRQSDLEELLTGPPASAAYGPDGQLTPAGAGFAKKQGVEPSALERIETPKGVYVGVRKHHRGKTTVDVLPGVLAGVLRSLAFPKHMRWDATLDDGRGELPFGRPIRWMLFLYGGRVVPFRISRTAPARSSLVQDVHAGAVTFGHRVLTTSARAGRAIKVKHFDDYKKRLAENFVVLERSERHDRIARELDAEARRRKGRVANALVGHAMLDEVPDLVEYPVVVSGTFAHEFLQLPEEVLATTMIHHQHFFPVTNDHGQVMPVFLAVLNMQPDAPEVIAKNMERVLTARLRDARFFLDADREKPLGDYVERLGTVLFHKKLGSYQEKSVRLEHLARVLCADVLGRADVAEQAAEAARLCKADLATSMVRELTELQGAIGGIYARENGRPEEVWRAIYHHYLPVAVEAEAAPTKEQLGPAAVTWAAVSMADKLDTLAGLFAAGERPTGSRDPYGLRRAAQGLVRILVDLPELTGIDRGIGFGPLLDCAGAPWADTIAEWRTPLEAFLVDRLRFVLEQRGSDVRNVRAVTHHEPKALVPLFARRLLAVLPEFTGTDAFRALASVFKRVRNIARSMPDDEFERLAPDAGALAQVLTEPAERALVTELMARRGAIMFAADSGTGYRDALASAAHYGPTVARFFDDVLVMAEDSRLRQARLFLMRALEFQILRLADVSEIVPEE